MRKYTCPCCGYKTLDSEHDYDICPICFWEDDSYQYENPHYKGGTNNEISLYDAQINYKRFGTCDYRCINSVRKPSMDDEKDTKWKPLMTINEKFIMWLQEHKNFFEVNQVETEEIKITEGDSTEYPCVVVYHYKPEKFIGIIQVWENNMIYIEIQEYKKGNTLLLNHEEYEEPNLDNVFRKYLDILRT